MQLRFFPNSAFVYIEEDYNIKRDLSSLFKHLRHYFFIWRYVTEQSDIA